MRKKSARGCRCIEGRKAEVTRCPDRRSKAGLQRHSRAGSNKHMEVRVRSAKGVDERGCGCAFTDAGGVYPNQSAAWTWRRARPKALVEALSRHAACPSRNLGSATQKRERNERRGALSHHAPNALLQRACVPAAQAVAHRHRSASRCDGSEEAYAYDRSTSSRLTDDPPYAVAQCSRELA